MPSPFDDLAIEIGSKLAASKKILVVSSSIPVVSPPIIPPKPSTFSLSAMTQ